MKHCITARHTGGFGVHSPYIFSFIQHVLREKHPYQAFAKIEFLRKELPAKNGSLNPKLAQIIFRIINRYKFKKLLELGTGMGVETMYMASVASENTCISIEENIDIVGLPQHNFEKLKLKNTQFIHANIEKELSQILSTQGKQDFILIHANRIKGSLMSHLLQCLAYVNENAMIVITNIHANPQVETVWQQIQEQVNASLDIYHMGIIFMNPTLCKKQYRLYMKIR